MNVKIINQKKQADGYREESHNDAMFFSTSQPDPNSSLPIGEAFIIPTSWSHKQSCFRMLL